MHAVVLVLGDVGRSPRMQYHALSLAAEPDITRVSLVGLVGERCMPAVEAQAKITPVLIQPLSELVQKLPRVFFPLYALIKISWQIFQLVYLLLWSLPRADTILVQNPPCIPTFVVAWLAVRVRGGALVIDWHNLGYTILDISLRNTKNAWLVGVARIYEHYCSHLADQHLCVTGALRAWLVDNFGIDPDKITVLHDQAPEHFAALNTPERHELFKRLDAHFQWPELENSPKASTIEEGTTLFTEAGPPAHMRVGRPSLVISSTSWTPDEDFSVLLDAIVELDLRIQNDTSIDPILFGITGKGPQKAMYEERMQQLKLKRIKVTTLWLESADYPLLVGAADLGVCLHTSSSGLDLPMKVLDMFGAGLPVCAWYYPCLSKELVKEGDNGYTFTSSSELAEQLYMLLSNDRKELIKLQQKVRTKKRENWESNWTKEAWPVFKKCRGQARVPLVLPIIVSVALVVALVYETREQLKYGCAL